MTKVVFYEKPGCRNNTKQKTWLAASGHEVEARDLLAQPWAAETLRPFFGTKPVAEWFNKAAPQVKSGEIDPAAFTAEDALAAMVADPLLIRRPLLDVDGEKRSGFDPESVRAWIGLTDEEKGDVETCPTAHAGRRCGGS